MTNQEKLIEIRDKHALTRQQLADLAMVDINTVHGWLRPKSNAAYRAVKERDLVLIRYQLLFCVLDDINTQ